MGKRKDKAYLFEVQDDKRTFERIEIDTSKKDAESKLRRGLLNVKRVRLLRFAEIEPINWKRVNNDVNGNPRYVCHFLNLINDDEHDISARYELALKRARKLGGRKFHNKQYGGGIVFQSYNVAYLECQIALAKLV